MRILILIFIYNLNMNVKDMAYISTITSKQMIKISPEHTASPERAASPERTTSPERAAELCLNWWPTPSLANAASIPGMPHPLCRMCANWLPDIEDIGIVLNNITCYTKNKVGCGNDWAKEKNTPLNEKGQ